MDKTVTPDELDDFLNTSDRTRGAIISHTVLLERNMDLFICRYFCHTEVKVLELMELLVSERVDLSKKSETFVQILIKECEKSGEDFNKKYPRIKTDLKEIYETRNAFAHKLTLTPIKSDIGKYVIVLREFKNKTTYKSYTQEDFENLIRKIEKYSVMIKNRNNPNV